MNDVERILEERARLFARPLPSVRAEATVDLVCFEIGSERFAIAASVVQRIVPMPRATPLPGTPPHVVGIVNVRRQLVPVFDLARLLGIPAADGARELIVLGRAAFEFGILADAVTELVTLAAEARRTSGEARPVVQRVLPDGRALIDGAALLDDPRLVIGPITARSAEEEIHR